MMGRFPCCDHDTSGLKKGPWTPEEDEKLVDYITKNGHGCWRSLPKLAGLNRCGKSCRLRWTNYIRPDIKRGKFTEEEESLIISLHSALGNKWSKIAGHLPGRTDNEIKNYWNTCLRKKLLQMGIDPNTHKPRTGLDQSLIISQLLSSSQHLTHLIMNSTTLAKPTWENALKFQAQTADQLVKIQLLQNLLRFVNSAGVAKSIGTSFLGHQNLNPQRSFEACNDGYRSAVLSTDYQTQNFDFVHCDGSRAIDHSSSRARIEDGKIKGMRNSAKDLQGIHEDAMNPLPGLVSEPFKAGNILGDEPKSAMFEAWDKLLDSGDTSESYWKDILELISDSSSP